MCFLFKVCAELDGHVWGRLCGDLDRPLGGHLPYVDLWSLQLFKGDKKTFAIFCGNFLFQDISLMIGSQPFILTKVCWAFVCPVALLVRSISKLCLSLIVKEKVYS